MDKRLRYLIQGLLFSWLALFVQGASAEKVYTFVGAQFPFILEQQEPHRPFGVSVEVLDSISQRSDIKFEIKLMPWPRALRMVKLGMADGLIGPYKSPERMEYMDYSEQSFYTDSMVLLRLSTGRFDPADWSGDLSELYGKKVIVMRGWEYSEAFSEAKPNMQLIEVSSVPQALRMLQKKRAEYLVLNKRNALRDMIDLGLEREVAILEPPLSTKTGFFGFSKLRPDPEFQRVFNRVMKDVLEEGLIRTDWQ